MTTTPRRPGMHHRFFIKGPSAKDPRQGFYIPNCYLISSMSAVAKARPEAIRNSLKRNRDGSVSVRFFRNKGDGKVAPEYVRLNRQTIARTAREVKADGPWARSTTRGELWPALIERAYNRWPGRNKVKAVQYAMEALTGKPAEGFYVKSKTPAQLFERLRTAVASRSPAVISTKNSAVRPGLISNHGYSVLRAFEKKGRQYVTLRNPHARNEPAGNGRNDGIFTLPLSAVVRNFLYATVQKSESALARPAQARARIEASRFEVASRRASSAVSIAGH